MEATTQTRALPTFSTLLRLAWPMVVSRSTQVVLGLADAWMVAHLGESALAATTTGSMNAMAIFILPMGTVFIVGTFSSQLFGKGDRVGARRFAWYGLMVAGTTQLVCLALLPLLGKTLHVFEFTDDVRRLLEAYLRVRLISGGAVITIEALAAYYGGLGNTRLPMLANILAMVFNLFGNWLLIDGHLGFPALGVAGSAWASTFSSGLASVVLLSVFLWQGRGKGTGGLKAEELWRTLRYGVPAGLNWFFEFFAFLFFINVVLAGLGTTALAAFMGAMQLNSVAFMPSFALAGAGAIVVGQAIGAGAESDVPKGVRRTFVLAAGWQASIGLLYLLAPRLVFSPFAQGASATPELLEMGARMMMLSATWQLFDAAATTLAEALRAAGDTTFTLGARLFLAWLVFVPGAWITVHHFGGREVSAMFWLVAYLALLAATLFWRFRTGAWKRFSLVSREASA